MPKRDMAWALERTGQLLRQRTKDPMNGSIASVVDELESDILAAFPGGLKFAEDFRFLRRLCENADRKREEDLLLIPRQLIQTSMWQRLYYELALDVVRRMQNSEENEREERRFKEELAKLDEFFVDVAEVADRFPELRELTAVYDK